MLPSLLSLSAIVSAAPVGEELAPPAPDLEALTLFCKDIGRTRPTFESGCYTVTGLSGQQIGCDKRGRLIKLDLNGELWMPTVPQSIGNLVNLEFLYFNLTEEFE
jgi:hypothetical protein